MKRAQVAIEYLIIVMMSIVFFFVIITAITALSTEKTEEKTVYEIRDLGIALQEELLVATTLQDGYNRLFFIPETINHKEYTITTGNTSETDFYMYLTFNGRDTYFDIPPINGTITHGRNHIQKTNGQLIITQE